MLYKFSNTYLLIFTLIFSTMIVACTGSNDKQVVAMQELDSLMTNNFPADEPGATLLILKGDEIIFDKGYGLADLEKNTKIDGNTFFNIASVSKQFSATAIMKLAEEGKISLDDNVKKYFPHFKADFFNKITLRHLLSHTSGIQDERPRTDMNFVLYCTDVDSYAYMENINKLAFEPGSNYEYMNPTYQLFYTIIEQVSGKTFEEYMRENIFTPAGMENAVYFSSDKTIPNMAHGYIPNEVSDESSNADSDRSAEATALAKKQQENAKAIGNFKEYDYGEETFFASKADGGIYTSTHEFAMWEKALRNNTIISESMRKEAHSPKIKITGSPYSSYQNRPFTSYGYGWFIDENPNAPQKIYHTGDNGGFQIYAGRYTQDNVLVLIFANRNDKDRWTNVTNIENILVKGGILTK